MIGSRILAGGLLKYLKELLDITRKGFERVGSSIDRRFTNDRQKEPDAGPDARQTG